MILTGPATNLARVLGLRGIREWIKKKVRLLVVAAGRYPEEGPDYNIAHDVAAARKLFAEWPTSIVVAGDEVGREIPYPASSIENDFGWAPNHPVVDAYRAFQPMPYDAPSQAIAAALHAVRPDEGYFQLSEPGEVAVLDGGRTKFTPCREGPASLSDRRPRPKAARDRSLQRTPFHRCPPRKRPPNISAKSWKKYKSGKQPKKPRKLLRVQKNRPQKIDFR